MIGTFNALLEIARAEAGSDRAGFEPVDLAELTRDLAELYAPLAEDRGSPSSAAARRRLGAGEPPSAGPGARQPARQRDQVHARAAARCGCRVETAPRGPAITVADTGPGIPAAERERVLERFVRLDATRSTPGNGLGLSLVSAVAKLHGATLTLEDNHPGLRVRLVLAGAAAPRSGGLTPVRARAVSGSIASLGDEPAEAGQKVRRCSRRTQECPGDPAYRPAL